MNKKRTICTIIVAALLAAAACLTACSTSALEPQKTDKPAATATGIIDDATKAPDSEATELITTAPTDEPVITPTDAPTPAHTEAPLPEPGTMVYYEDFSSYGNVSKNDEVAKALGWKLLTVEADGAPSDLTATLAIKDGKLEVTNFNADGDSDGKDGYLMMLNDAYMDKVLRAGEYTVEYDVTYNDAANYKRYVNVVTEYNREGFNSFHFRIGGYGNNQLYYQGTWFKYEENTERNLYAARKGNNEIGQTIAFKLRGIEGKIEDNNAIPNFKGVPVTIRVVRANGYASVYMKTAEMNDFIQVSETTETSEAFNTGKLLKGKAVCFKVGGKINASVDRIAIWTGGGEMPADHTVTYVP